MNLLLDTHYLLWAALKSPQGSQQAWGLINDPNNRLWFSVVSLWEVAIKRGLDRPDFKVEPGILRAGLLSAGYKELSIEARHIFGLSTLPHHHSDPFDRLLIMQAAAEGMMLLTADRRLAAYQGPIILA
jgi:PIN domain nuclease of toxin-antitoxin system